MNNKHIFRQPIVCGNCKKIDFVKFDIYKGLQSIRREIIILDEQYKCCDYFDWHLMDKEPTQCIDYKDKAGTLLFVGDIVKVKTGLKKEEYITEIIHDRFGFNLKYNKTTLHKYFCLMNIQEVVGNIYQHNINDIIKNFKKEKNK